MSKTPKMVLEGAKEELYWISRTVELVDNKPDHRKPDGLLSYFSGFFCFRQFISGQLVLVVFLPANLLISIYYLFSIYYITYK